MAGCCKVSGAAFKANKYAPLWEILILVATASISATAAPPDLKDINMKLTLPGTKWCGGGNNAENPDDLGLFKWTDACCREHDMCPDVILAGDTKYGLHNTGHYTKCHCDCEEKFYDCLKNVESPVSAIAGVIYFTVIGSECFREEYPVTSCSRYYGLFIARCKMYEFDTSLPKEWQWFDAPVYFPSLK